jgi:predicted ATP-dependent serine protease
MIQMTVTNSAANQSKSFQAFDFKSIQELLSLPDETVPYCVDGLLPSSGLSVLAAKPKAGKSTIARQCAVAVCQGKQFFDRGTSQGAVLYLAIEEKASEVRLHLKQLGITDADPLHVICGAIPKNEAFGKLEASLVKYKGVKLVIIDPIFRFVGVKDSNDYVEVNNAFEKLLELARKYEVHILAVHHMKKRETEDPMDGALGSTAIAAAVDTYIALKVNAAGQRTVSSRQRYGTALEETHLVWNPESRQNRLGESSEQLDMETRDATRKRIEHDIRSYVASNPGCTQDAICNTVRGNRSVKLAVFQSLVDSRHLVKQGEGVKGAPYIYSLAELPTEEISSPAFTHSTGEQVLGDLSEV